MTTQPMALARIIAIALAATVTISFLGACGASAASPARPAAASAAPKAAIPGDETRTAERLLISSADFPPGWSETPSSTNHSTDACIGDARKSQTGRAETGDISNVAGDDVHETLAIYATPSEAVATMGLFRSQLDCVAQMINAGQTDTSDAHFSNATVSSVDYVSLGDRSTALRLSFHYSSASSGSEGDISVDTLWVISGRYAFDLQGTALSQTFDSNLLSNIAGKALARIAG